jgi:hypothetical protein
MMLYWIVVLTIWIVSLLFVTFRGVLIYEFVKSGVLNTQTYIGIGLFSLGLLLNFITINWPTEGGAPTQPTLDKRTLKALEIMSRTVKIAPNAVKEGLERIVEKFSTKS